MQVPYFFYFCFLTFLIGIPVDFLIAMIPDAMLPIQRGALADHSGIALAVFLIVFGAIPLVLFFLLVEWDKMPKRKLNANRQWITLTDTAGWGAKERRINVSGAKICAVHFDFFERLFTFDLFRIDYAYQIEISRGSETFLFPCNDEREQSQIIKQINEFLAK